uniref:Uncharacterized protein n=1 Tax=Tetraselmis sp. GSL018 TaxID=582737 RepID=A0A061QZ36_9CHLO|mmetsp:Transcript_42576/g.101095  ORF Transcript_42576/g.101095 Transcript_42576/m.101095 type:complete len:232 (-) Transcript_42576:104-799(-)
MFTATSKIAAAVGQTPARFGQSQQSERYRPIPANARIWQSYRIFAPRTNSFELYHRALPRSAAHFVFSATVEQLAKEKLISQVEIPNFIMRDDFIDQLYRWTLNAGSENAGKTFGMPCSAEPVYTENEEGSEVLWGWKTSFVKAGQVSCEVYCGFDTESTKKYRWVGRNLETGMPELEGDYEEVKGRYFEIWKLGKDSVDEDTRAAIKAFCTELADAVNKYYAFGSCWAEE